MCAPLLRRRTWSENSTWMSYINGPRSYQRLEIICPRSTLWPQCPLQCQMRRARRTNRIPAFSTSSPVNPRHLWGPTLSVATSVAWGLGRFFYVFPVWLCLGGAGDCFWFLRGIQGNDRYPPGRPLLLWSAISLEGGKDLIWWRGKCFPSNLRPVCRLLCAAHTSPSHSGFIIPHNGSTQPA